MSDRYSMESEYAEEFEDTEFEAAEEFEDTELYEDSEFEAADELSDAEVDEFEWETVARPSRPHPQGRPAPGGGSVTFPPQTVTVRPVHTLFGFCFNESSLMERHINDIKALAPRVVAAARTGPITVRLVGHTDSIGKPDANKKLGLRRAQEVGKKLRLFLAPLLNRARRSGMRLGRVSVIEQSVGEQQPTSPVSNRTEAGRAKNRRVQIFFTRAKTP